MCQVPEGARWGVLLHPPNSQQPQEQAELRLVLFVSFWIGQATLHAALAYLRRLPGRIRVVGVVTDDPISPQARISLRKRAWSLMSEEERLAVKLRLVRTALEAGIPVYTGEVKTPGFRRVLAAWQPDAIITCGFGQVLDRAILDTAPQGAYNCHPTDLANGHGAGPSPWADMEARGVTHTVWSVHRMTEEVDAGPVIGRSAPINLADAAGRLVREPRAFVYKILAPICWMALCLIDSLVRARPGPLRRLDLDSGMPAALRRQLLQPIGPDWQDTQVPVPGDAEFAGLLNRPASRIMEDIAAG
ncbi:formyltransferase family protein [Roseicella aerolata]|uniref:Formyl transferase N-terminal domain-containing protein n=1 Tax=Roseicella aerolata TaxID=2883479 RepID=A0A9X1LBA0_9PROT|nr:hypothetical protein [Roseicella aerolata]